MADLETVIFSVSTTLALQAAYYTILRFPDLSNENVASMAAFHQLHLADAKETRLITSQSQKAVDALASTYNFFAEKLDKRSAGATELLDRLKVAAATLRGYRDSNSTTDSFITLVEEKVQNAIGLLESSTDAAASARAIQIDLMAVDGAVKIQRQRITDRNVAYNLDMQRRQASIKVVGLTGRVATFGIQGYIVVVAVWICLVLHRHEIGPLAAVPTAVSIGVIALFALRRAIDRTLRPSSELLKEVQAQIGREK